MANLPDRIEPTLAAELVRSWGFLADPDLPDRPGPAYLLVAIRARPTLLHYDPELVEYWITDEKEHGVRETITYASRLPRSGDFSWGRISVVDRKGYRRSEYLRDHYPKLWTIMLGEERRLKRDTRAAGRAEHDSWRPPGTSPPATASPRCCVRSRDGRGPGPRRPRPYLM